MTGRAGRARGGSGTGPAAAPPSLWPTRCELPLPLYGEDHDRRDFAPSPAASR